MMSFVSLLVLPTLLVTPAPTNAVVVKAVHLHVSPMRAPEPALKYLLLPEVRELNPGNPAQWYVRCFAEQSTFFFSKEGVAMRERYRTMPLNQLAREGQQDFGGSALRQADYAARLAALDWEVAERIQKDGLDVRTPELAPLEVLGRALQVRLRARIAIGDFSGAITTAKTMFALARDLGRYPTLAGNRTGLAVASLAVDGLQEMMQQPGCPNLYWALTDLPDPLIDVRTGMQGEKLQVDVTLAGLSADRAMSQDELEQFIRLLSGRIGYLRERAGLPPWSFRAALQARVNDRAGVQAARRRLVAQQTPQDTLTAKGAYQTLQLALRMEKYPPTQIILLDEKHSLDVQRDAACKLLGLQPCQIIEPPTRSQKGLLHDFLPDINGLRLARARLQCRLVLLRYIEALRLYAASHPGQLPARLADVPVALPHDPFTGQPFQYHLEGKSAHLSSGLPRGKDARVGYNVHYEITIR